jgi:tetratricopeptide (TPR) repeat protein
LQPRVRGDKLIATAEPEEGSRIPVSTVYRDAGPLLEIQSTVGKYEAGSLQIQKTPDGLWMAPQARSQARAERLASELASGPGSRFDRIASFPGVARCISLPEQKEYLVRFQGESRWLKAPESAAFEVTPDAWLNSADANVLIRASGERMTILPKGKPLDGTKVEIHNRGPPEGSVIALLLGGSPVPAVRDAQGGLHLPRSDLSGDFEADLRALGKLDAPEAASLLERANAGDFESVADALSHKPELSDEFGKLRDAELSAARELLRGGNPVEAARNLERLANVFPNDPEVLAALALAQAQRGETARAVGALNGAFRAKPLAPESVAALLEKVTTRTPLFDAVANALSHRLALPGGITAFETPSGIGLRVSLRDNVSFKLLSQPQDGAPYFAAPGYFSSEWTPPLNYSLEQLPAVRIPESLRKLEPMVIESPRGGQLIWRDLVPPKK